MADNADYDAATDKILENIQNGVKSVRFADGRQYENIIDPAILSELRESKAANSSPFVRVGFTGRPV